MSDDFDMIKDIPRYREWKKITVPKYGWSINKKFHIIDHSNQEYILRVSDIAHYDKKKNEYENIVRLSKTVVHMPMPIDFGICNNGESVYLLLTWVEGVAVEDVIKTLDLDTQYELGCKAGRLLKKLHDASAVPSALNWRSVYKENIDTIINAYRQTNVRIHDEQNVVNYTMDHLSLLDNRPQVIRHGDFHVGNLIIMPGSEIGVIDFDLCSVGDGWEEFGGIEWAARLSPAFARGQVDGYFEKNVPNEFFKLLALYVAVYALEHVVRSAGTRSAESLLHNTDGMTSMFDHYRTYIPNWYKGEDANAGTFLR